MSFHDFAWRAKELRRGRTASKATGRPLLPNTRSRQMTQAITCAFPRLRVSRGKVSDTANAAHSGHGSETPIDRYKRQRGERASGKRQERKRPRYEIRNPAALQTQTQVGPIQMDGTHLYISREPIPREFLFLGASVTSETLLPHALEPKLEVEANGTLTPADVDASRPRPGQDQEHPDQWPEQYSHRCVQGPSSEEASYSRSAREQSLTQKEKAQSWAE